jgi:hypothetical protein
MRPTGLAVSLLSIVSRDQQRAVLERFLENSSADGASNERGRCVGSFRYIPAQEIL